MLCEECKTIKKLSKLIKITVLLTSPFLLLLVCTQASAKTTQASVSFYIAEEDKGIQIKTNDEGKTYIQNLELLNCTIYSYDNNGFAYKVLDITDKDFTTEYTFENNKKYSIVFEPQNY